MKVNSDEADATLSPTVEADHLVEPTDIPPEPAGAFAASPQTTGSAERMRYRAALAGWMASKGLKELRMGGAMNIATAFKIYCQTERQDLLHLLPKRLRSMEGTIERIIEDRVLRTQQSPIKNKPAKSQ